MKNQVKWLGVTNIHRYKRLIKGQVYPRELLIVAIPLIVLALVSTSSAIHAAYQVSNNSDYLLYPYFFQHFKLHDILLPKDHSNLLLFPLYLAQAIFPYKYAALAVVDVGLILVTVWWWAYLLVRVYGRRYLPIICITIAAVVLGSTNNSFIGNLAGNTIRNIEYPLGFAFVLLMNDILRGKKFTRFSAAYGLLIIAFLSLAVAGDDLLLLVTALPILLVIFFYWLQSTKFTAAMMKVTGLTVFSVILAYVLQKVLVSLGIISLVRVTGFHTVPASSVPFSATTTLRQILGLQNANVFGQSQIVPSSAILFVNFIILCMAVLGLVLTLKQVIVSYRNRVDIATDGNFIGAVIATTFFLVPLVYIVTDQVVHPLISQQLLVSNHQERYLTVLPLLTVAGFVLLLQRYYRGRRTLFVAISLAIITCIVLSFHFVNTEQNYTDTAAARGMRSSVNSVIMAAHSNEVPVILAGYWYAAPIRFYSLDTIQTASITACRGNALPTDFNTRLSWYKPDPAVHRSGLLIDVVGPDALPASCLSQLSGIFGVPNKVVYPEAITRETPTGIPYGDGLQLWVYNYDIRTKVSTANLEKIIQR